MQTGFNYKNVISVSFVNRITCSLTHWGLLMHVCVNKLIIIGSDNGLSPSRSQAIIWTNARISSIWPLGTKLIETLIEIYTFSFKKMHFNMSPAKWRPFCLGLNVLIQTPHDSDLAGSTDNKIQSILINRWHVFSRKISLITRLTHVLFLETPGLDVFILIDDLDWLSITFELFHDNITKASHQHHGISDHCQLGCLLNQFETSKKYQITTLLALWGKSTGDLCFSLIKASNAIPR